MFCNICHTFDKNRQMPQRLPLFEPFAADQAGTDLRPNACETKRWVDHIGKCAAATGGGS